MAVNSGFCDTVRRAHLDNNCALPRHMVAVMTVSRGVVVRESCYPFYEPSFTELSHGCSQEVESVKRW
jgi:hypothetical protein